MRLKHNKKRNTAFLFECLIKELTKATILKEGEKKKQIILLLKEYFKQGTILGEELRIYRSLYETKSVDSYTAEKIVIEAKKAYGLVNKKQIFNEQTKLINRIDKALGKGVWSNFVPNYKSLATIYQVFNSGADIKTKVLLENRVLYDMISKKKEEAEMKPVDNIVFKTFVKKFNEKYGEDLLEEQKNLISSFVASLSDESSTEFKMFISEEISRISGVLSAFKNNNPGFGETPRLQESIEILNSFKTKDIEDDDLKMVLKLQRLAKELE